MRLHGRRYSARSHRYVAGAARLTAVAFVAVLQAATDAAAQGARVPKPGPVVYPWMERLFHFNIYVKMPDEPDARLVLGHVSDWGSASRALSWRLAR